MALDVRNDKGGEVRFALAGDLMLAARVSDCTAPDFLELVAAMRSADVAAANLETLFHDFEGYPAVHCGGSHVRADPSLVEEVKWLGFRMVSMANNHAGDYGTQGILAHIDHVAASGLVHAGLGRNLESARAPGIMESRVGGVALISCTSTIPAGMRAGHDRPDVRGRPGVNPLRFETVELIDAETMAAVRHLESRMEKRTRVAREDEVVIGGQRFRRAASRGTLTCPHEGDLAALVASIRSVRDTVDWVIVALHAHRNAPGDRSKPADFIKTCARAAVAAGADIVFGHGPHVLRGIEIHEGKPIFYSLGNFVVQYDRIERHPADTYELCGLSPNASPEELRERMLKRAEQRSDERIWESLLATPIFSKGRLMRIELLPAIIEKDAASRWRGLPMLARGKEAARILEKMAKLSEEFGTEIEIRGSVGTVLVRAPAAR